MYLNLDSLDVWNNYILYICYQFHPWKKIIQTPKKNNKCCEDELSEATPDDHPDDVTVEEKRRSSEETETVPSEDTATEREDPVSVLRARAEDRMFPGTT